MRRTPSPGIAAPPGLGHDVRANELV